MGVIVWYQANKDYVADVLCINKDKPELHCNGKCYLKKQLKKVDDNTTNDKEAPAKKTKNQLPEYIASSNQLAIFTTTVETVQHKTFYNNTYYHHHLSSVFHPPQEAC